jgi:hypothetical protein
MNTEEKGRNDRPEAYPKPNETDQQLKNQPEYIDQQPNDFRDKSISDMPAESNAAYFSNDPASERQDSEEKPSTENKSIEGS